MTKPLEISRFEEGKYGLGEVLKKVYIKPERTFAEGKIKIFFCRTNFRRNASNIQKKIQILHTFSEQRGSSVL